MFHLFLFTDLDLTLLQKVSSHFIEQRALNFSYQGSSKGMFIMLSKGLILQIYKPAFWMNVTIPNMEEQCQTSRYCQWEIRKKSQRKWHYED